MAAFSLSMLTVEAITLEAKAGRRSMIETSKSFSAQSFSPIKPEPRGDPSQPFPLRLPVLISMFRSLAHTEVLQRSVTT